MPSMKNRLKSVIINLAFILTITSLTAADAFKAIDQKQQIQLRKMSAKDISLLNEEGLSPLLYSIQSGFVTGTEILLEKGADPNSSDPFGYTALMYAVDKKDRNLIELLLTNKAEINKQNKYGSTSLIYAYQSGWQEVITFLVFSGGDPGIKDKYSKSLWQYMLENGDESLYMVLLNSEKKSDFALHRENLPLILEKRMNALLLRMTDMYKKQIFDGTESSLLFNSISTGNSQALTLLLKLGANIYSTDSQNRDIWDAALDSGKKDLIEVLSKEKRILEYRDGYGRTPFSRACMMEFTDAMDILYRAGGDPESRDMNDLTPYLLASRDNLLQSLKWLNDRGIRTDVHNKFGWGGIHLAAYNNHLETLKWMDDNGISLTETDSSRDNAAVIAYVNGGRESGDWLVSRGLSLEERDGKGHTAFMRRSLDGRTEEAQLLMEAGVSLNDYDYSGYSPFILTALAHNWPLSRLIRKSGGLLTDRKGQDALQYSAMNNDRDLYKFSLSQGLTPGQKDNETASAFLLAVTGGSLDVLALMLKDFPAMAGMSELGVPYLFHALKAGQSKIIELLVKAGADVDIKDSEGNTPWLLSAKKGWTESASFLESAGADTRVRDREGVNLLLYSCRIGSKSALNYALDKNIPINSTDVDGLTALMTAINQKQMHLIKPLVDAGIDVNAVSRAGMTASHYAAQYNQAKILMALSTVKGVMMDESDEDSMTPLMYALENGARESALFLLKSGVCDTEKRNNDLSAAPHFAAESGMDDILKWLLKNGTDLDMKDGKGLTPLHLAVFSKHAETVKLLLNMGVDVNARDDKGRTALRYASGRTLRGLLKEAGAVE